MAFAFDASFDNAAPLTADVRNGKRIDFFPGAALPTGNLTVVITLSDNTALVPIVSLDLELITDWPFSIDISCWPAGTYNITTTEATNPFQVHIVY